MTRPPRQHVIPSQRRSPRTPYYPGVQADVENLQQIIQPHVPGQGTAPSAYVISTYDARPINSVDWQTQSGTDASDFGYVVGGGTEGPGGDAYVLSQTFYTVPAGYQAVLRNYHILMIPATGEQPSNNVFGPNNESNFLATVSILVDGVYQNGQAGIQVRALAFGDVFGECYVLADEGSTIEFRIECGSEESSFYQALVSLYGNLFLSKTGQLEFTPATQATIPVHDQQAREGI